MLLFLVILLVSLTKFIASDNSPVVTFGDWTSVDNYNWEHNETAPITFADKTNKTITVPAYINGFSLLCNDTYPIEWNFHQDKWGFKERWTVFLTTRRFALDIYNVSSFKYSAEIRFQGDSNTITGNYTCQRIGDKNAASSVYMFWEGTSPPFLLLAGEQQTVKYNKNSKVFTLPCRVSVPTVEVKLFKEYTYNTTTSMVPLLKNSSIAYKNTEGFILKDLKNPYGRYRCVADMEMYKDYVETKVIPGDSVFQSEFNDTKLSNASFKYDSKAKQFVCCSSTARPPKMMHYYCDHPITCKLKIHMLHNVESSSSRWANGSCAIMKLKVKHAGVFRCLGDSIDIMREYFFPIGQGLFTRRRQWLNPLKLNSSINEKPFFSWKEAVPEKMLSITTRAEGVIYAGQNVTFDCQVSPYYFSEGIKWGVSMGNGTNTSFVILNGAAFSYGSKAFRLYTKRNHAFIKITADQSITSVVCIAPVWNSTEWKNTTLQLNIQVPHSPNIIGGDLPEEIHWYVNDTQQSLQCSAEGIPTPAIYWRKDNATLRYDAVKYVNGTSTVNISRVSYENHGVYICFVKNFAGAVKKEFHVYVDERYSASTISIVVVSVFGAVATAIGIGLLVKKMREQKKTIRQLANVAFKDVEQSQPQATVPPQPQPEAEPQTPQPSTSNAVRIPNSTISSIEEDGNPPSSNGGGYRKM